MADRAFALSGDDSGRHAGGVGRLGALVATMALGKSGILPAMPLCGEKDMMNRPRLDPIAPDLVAWGDSLPLKDEQRVAFRVSKWACVRSGVPLDIDLINNDELANIIAEYDERYFYITERNGGLDPGGEARQWFNRARALSAVMFASTVTDGGDFLDSLYEAYAATENIKELRALCKETASDSEN